MSGRGGCLAKACEPNKEQLRVHPDSQSIPTLTVQMASSTAADKPKQPKLDVDKYLTTAISATPAELHPYFESFQNLHSRKYDLFSLSLSRRMLMWVLCSSVIRLWHQLTLKLVEFFDDPASQPYQVDVYDRFVRDFATKLNPLKLVEMGVKVSRQIDSAFLIRRSSSLVVHNRFHVQIPRTTSVSSPISFQESTKTNHRRLMYYYLRPSPGQNSSLGISKERKQTWTPRGKCSMS